MSDNIVNLEDKRRILKAAQDDEALCIMTVRADMSINVWVSDRIETGEQWAWLHGQLAAGTHQLVEMEGSCRPFAPVGGAS
jgi:hypothetical protein